MLKTVYHNIRRVTFKYEYPYVPQERCITLKMFYTIGVTFNFYKENNNLLL